MSERIDVAVVGAGPAGSVFATRMARLGHAVTLIEAAAFPRPRLGESLTPGVMPMLASIGVAPAIAAAAFPRVRAVATNWEGEETERVDPREEGVLVDRGAFDAILLAHAKGAGVRVLQPASLKRAREAHDGWRLHVEQDGSAVELHAGFLCDASGRASRLGARRASTGPSTLAIHGYWRGPSLPRRPRIEARPRGWCWGVPIPDGTYNALAFVDAARVREPRSASLDVFLRELLEGSALARDLEGATLVGAARATDATPYVDEGCVGPTRIRVGDAALAIDPLSSSGVQKAIQTALSGAIVANTLLRRPAARDAAIRFHRDSVRDASDRHRGWTTGHYAAAGERFDDTFWRARSEGARRDDGALPRELPDIDCPLRLSPDAVWSDVPCLGAEHVEVRRALAHPSLEGPVAYLGGHELARLLEGAPDGLSARDLVRSWSGALPLDVGVSVVRWLASRGVLERADRATGSPST